MLHGAPFPGAPLAYIHQHYNIYIIDKLHTTEIQAITHTQGGCANRHRGGASVVCSLSGLY